MGQTVFNPFYERIANLLGWRIIGKLLISLLAGLLFFIPYYSYVGIKALHNWSWFLGLVISCALMFLFFATATLCSLFPHWKTHLGPRQTEIFQKPLNKTLSDRNILLAGISFGLLNMLMGYCFGVPSTDHLESALLLFGYFLAGFACGMPAYGIYGVLVTIDTFTRHGKLHFDYTAPDRCGGMSFMGIALVKFSIVTLLEGVLIASYILLVDWTNADNGWVQLLMWGWIIFPFILSLLVLLVPSADINKMLINYRYQKEQELQQRCSLLQKQIENLPPQGDNKEVLRNEYDFLCQRREEAHELRTWPFNPSATTAFVGVFVSNLLLAKELADLFLSK